MTIKLSKEDWVEKYVQSNLLNDLKEHAQAHSIFRNIDPIEEYNWLIDQEYQCYIDNFPKD